MKRFLIAFLLLVSTPVIANGPTFTEQLHNCVDATIEYTMFATLAHNSTESQHPAYIAYIQQIADKQDSKHFHDMVIHLGKAAWLAREAPPDQFATEVFDQCYKNIGLRL